MTLILIQKGLNEQFFTFILNRIKKRPALLAHSEKDKSIPYRGKINTIAALIGIDKDESYCFQMHINIKTNVFRNLNFKSYSPQSGLRCHLRITKTIKKCNLIAHFSSKF